ncbi:MAG: DMT family transporter [Burkholderiales bacterium]|nr:DMT family transporter [Burkholderiales bacterium]
MSASTPATAHTFPREAVWLLTALTLGWGFNWPVMKIVLTEMAPLHFRTWCLFFGAAGVFLIARANRLPIGVPEGAWGKLVVISLFNMTGWNILAIYGIPLLESGRAAILGYTMPVWSVVLGTMFLGERFTARRALGVALGMAGMALLFGGEVAALGRSPLGATLMVAAAISWAIGTVLMKRWKLAMPASTLTAWQMLIGGVPIVLLALFVEKGSFRFWELSLWPALGVVYNLTVAFVFAQWAWIKIALLAPIGVSTLSTLMIPVVGVFSGMLVLGERPHWTDFAALALVVASLATVMPLPAFLQRTRR